MIQHKIKQEKAREGKGKQGKAREGERTPRKPFENKRREHAEKQNKKEEGILRESGEKQGKPRQTQRTLGTTSHAGLASLASWAKKNTENIQRNKQEKARYNTRGAKISQIHFQISQPSQTPPKSIPNPPKNLPKTTPNLQKSTQNRPQDDKKSNFYLESPLLTLISPSLVHLGFHLAPQTLPKSKKINEKSMWKKACFFKTFFHQFFSIFDLKIHVFFNPFIIHYSNKCQK